MSFCTLTIGYPLFTWLCCIVPLVSCTRFAIGCKRRNLFTRTEQAEAFSASYKTLPVHTTTLRNLGNFKGVFTPGSVVRKLHGITKPRGFQLLKDGPMQVGVLPDTYIQSECLTTPLLYVNIYSLHMYTYVRCCILLVLGPNLLPEAGRVLECFQLHECQERTAVHHHACVGFISHPWRALCPSNTAKAA